MAAFRLQSCSSPSLSGRSPPSTLLLHIPTRCNLTCNSSFTRFKMSISSTPQTAAIPENHSVLGCGMAAVDFLVAVDSYPNPDDKIRSTSFQVQGGGNAGNALTCAARLGLSPRIISKVADDSQGKAILEELEADGVDTSFMVVSEGGHSTFSYVIVDSQAKTRTCIYTPGYPPMIPEDLSKSNLSSALDDVRFVYFDGVLQETELLSALVVAREAHRRNIPIVIDAERKRERVDDLLNLATYVVCSARFPQVWTEAPSIPAALVSVLLKLPNIKFVIVTLGEDGCMMLERAEAEDLQSEEIDVDELFKKMKQSIDTDATSATSISSDIAKLHAKGIGTVSGKLLLGTAEKIPPSELVDTTGAGDAFIGAVLYALCANMPPERMLPFASQVAAIGCRALGARAGLPQLTDPRL
ncbi:LOW QUALITY PROTEIN: ribokinase-like [Solanum tuberosum]|uniref:LOW QUALITY PROTEIN: ribokinase-like n=1 Tax=Solanum tuberosum TaxID=4113 RepID=UPI0003D261A4|nr:PREDICTED: LOW QUALITY PROTEIN: ribokinase-like [Solanum tuberosum]